MSEPGSRAILVVDDEFGMAEALSEILTSAGYRTATAANGAQGLEKAKSQRPDLILLDYMMPIMNGADMLRALRADPALASVPVIVMSAIDESAVRAECKDIAGFLRKPFDMKRLMKALAALGFE